MCQTDSNITKLIFFFDAPFPSWPAAVLDSCLPGVRVPLGRTLPHTHRGPLVLPTQSPAACACCVGGEDFLPFLRLAVKSAEGGHKAGQILWVARVLQLACCVPHLLGFYHPAAAVSLTASHDHRRHGTALQHPLSPGSAAPVSQSRQGTQPFSFISYLYLLSLLPSPSKGRKKKL